MSCVLHQCADHDFSVLIETVIKVCESQSQANGMDESLISQLGGLLWKMFFVLLIAWLQQGWIGNKGVWIKHKISKFLWARNHGCSGCAYLRGLRESYNSAQLGSSTSTKMLPQFSASPCETSIPCSSEIDTYVNIWRTSWRWSVN